MDKSDLQALVMDARGHTLRLAEDLEGEALEVPQRPEVNPPLWELNHLAWFQERWVLRHALGFPGTLPDAIFDSAVLAHPLRWTIELPSRSETLAALQRVRDRVVEELSRRPPTSALRYFTLLSIFHEDMHGEAFLMARQLLGRPLPPFLRDAPAPPRSASTAAGDVRFAGGRTQLGATDGDQFVFDNEKWAHPVEVEPFSLARVPITQGEFAAFVDAGGYRAQAAWEGPEASAFRATLPAPHPLFWRPGREGWERRHFDRWVPLEPDLPVHLVSHFEALAFCAFAGRRLPTEAEWEMAARASPIEGALDGRANGPVSVHAHPGSDSPEGLRQLFGNVWEWTDSDFGPYPGFIVDPYKEYSAPWFHGHKVLRGGSWATRTRLLRPTFRNFYAPHRRDVFAGFRTCAR